MSTRGTDDPVPPWIAQNLAFGLARAGAASASAFRTALAGLGIRPRHYSVLSVLSLLSDRAEPSSQQLVASCLQLDPSSLVDVVDELEAKVLLRRERDPADRRRNLLVLTPEGSRLLAEARDVAVAVEDTLLLALTPAERAQLATLLDKVSSTTSDTVTLTSHHVEQ